jgi:hypothetical protein
MCAKHGSPISVTCFKFLFHSSFTSPSLTISSFSPSLSSLSSLLSLQHFYVNPQFCAIGTCLKIHNSSFILKNLRLTNLIVYMSEVTLAHPLSLLLLFRLCFSFNLYKLKLSSVICSTYSI